MQKLDSIQLFQCRTLNFHLSAGYAIDVYSTKAPNTEEDLISETMYLILIPCVRS
jgi:hypothetical protein